MFGDILRGVKIISDIIFNLDEYKQNRNKDWSTTNLVILHQRIITLLMTGRKTVNKSIIVSEKLEFDAIYDFASSYLKFREAFESMGHNLDWDEIENRSFFDVLNIYIPDFINRYFKSLKYSYDYFDIYPSIKLYEFLTAYDYKHGNIDTKYGGEREFFQKLSENEKTYFRDRLEEFVVQINESLTLLESAKNFLDEFIRNNYTIEQISEAIKKYNKYDGVFPVQGY